MKNTIIILTLILFAGISYNGFAQKVSEVKTDETVQIPDDPKLSTEEIELMKKAARSNPAKTAQHAIDPRDEIAGGEVVLAPKDAELIEMREEVKPVEQATGQSMSVNSNSQPKGENSAEKVSLYRNGPIEQQTPENKDDGKSLNRGDGSNTQPDGN